MLKGTQFVIMILIVSAMLGSTLGPVGGESTSDIIINEFLPWPSTGGEYVELYNTGTVEIDLEGWVLDDSVNGSQPYPLEGKIGPGEHLTLWGNDTNIRLNNNGDSARLFDPSGSLIDEKEYEFADPGFPFSRLPDGGEWYSPLLQTPGAQNGDQPSENVADVFFSSLLPICTSSWEFVTIENAGPRISLEGWRISDGEGCWVLPDYTLSLGASCTIASNASRYENETGLIPDIVGQGDVKMGDEKEGIFLFDPFGRPVDVIWYGQAEPVGEGWIGVPAAAPREGYVMYRQGDTNTSADWSPLYHKIVGGTSFSGGEHDISAGTCFVSPDGGTAPFLSLIENASSSLYVNVYEITQISLINALVDSCERGVDVKLLLEGEPVSWNWTLVDENKASSSHEEAYIELYAADKITSAGGEVKFIEDDGTVDSRNERYRFNHAKYAIADGSTMILGTENWKPTGVPDVGKKGNRGWGILIRSPPLCNELETVFLSDWVGLGDTIEFGQNPYLPPPSWFTPEDHYSYSRPTPFAPMELEEEFNARLVIGPENHLEEDGPLSLIDGARETIQVELLDLSTEWYLGGETAPSPYVEALLEAARRGVDVHILLDSRYTDGAGGDMDNHDAMLWLNAISEEENISLEARLADLYSMNVDKVHNKGMIVDGEHVFISSMNWNANSVLRNREMGLIISSPEAAEYYGEVFSWDWEASPTSDASSASDAPLWNVEGFSPLWAGLIAIVVIGVILLIKSR